MTREVSKHGPSFLDEEKASVCGDMEATKTWSRDSLKHSCHIGYKYGVYLSRFKLNVIKLCEKEKWK